MMSESAVDGAPSGVPGLVEDWASDKQAYNVPWGKAMMCWPSSPPVLQFSRTARPGKCQNGNTSLRMVPLGEARPLGNSKLHVNIRPPESWIAFWRRLRSLRERSRAA